MSQADLANEAHTVWWTLFHDWRSFDAKWVRRLEAGEVVLTPAIVLCLAVAMRSDEDEGAILFEAGGFNGWNALKARKLGSGASILSLLEEGADNYEVLEPAEILHILKLRMQAEIRDAGES